MKRPRLAQEPNGGSGDFKKLFIGRARQGTHHDGAVTLPCPYPAWHGGGRDPPCQHLWLAEASKIYGQDGGRVASRHPLPPFLAKRKGDPLYGCLEATIGQATRVA